MAYTYTECTGTCSGRPNGKNPFTCFGRCVIEEQNARENYTKIRLQLWHGTSSTSWTWNSAVSERFCRVDGAYRYLGDMSVNNNPWSSNPCCLMDEEYTLYHDNNGDRYVDVWMRAYAYASGYGPGYLYVKNSNEAWGFNLPHIDRAATTVINSLNSVTTNSITINWDAYAACDCVQYSLNGGAWTTISGYPTYTLTGLTANTTYTVQTRARKTSNYVWGTASVLTIQTNPEPVVLNTLVASGDDPFTITVTASTDNISNTEQIVISTSADTKTITGGSGTVVLTATPDTTYTVTAVAKTVRSGVTSTKTVTYTTPADTFCSILSNLGVLSAKHKLYLIDTTGLKTEIKKSMCHIL